MVWTVSTVQRVYDNAGMMRRYFSKRQVSARDQMQVQHTNGDMNDSCIYTARLFNKSVGHVSATFSEKRWTWPKTSSRMMPYATFCLIVTGQKVSGRSEKGVMFEGGTNEETRRPETSGKT